MIFIDATLLVQKGFTIEREKLKLFAIRLRVDCDLIDLVDNFNDPPAEH